MNIIRIVSSLRQSSWFQSLSIPSMCFSVTLSHNTFNDFVGWNREDGMEEERMWEWKSGKMQRRLCKSKERRVHGVGSGRHSLHFWTQVFSVFYHGKIVYVRVTGISQGKFTAVNLLGYIKQNERKPMTVTEVSRLYSWVPTVKQPIRRLGLKCKIWIRAAIWSNCLHHGRISCVVVSILLSLFSKLRRRNVCHQTMVTFTFQEFNRTIILMAIC